MRKLLSCLSIIFLIFSCDDGDKIEVSFKDDLEINDLLSQSRYQKLNKDEDYKEYINDYYENWIEFNSTVYRGTDMMAESNLVDADPNADMSVDLLISFVKGAGAAVDGCNWDF